MGRGIVNGEARGKRRKCREGGREPNLRRRGEKGVRNENLGKDAPFICKKEMRKQSEVRKEKG